MANKLKVTIEGPAATGKTTLASLLTWALRKFNYTLVYSGADRQKWMQLSGDEMDLSHRLQDMFKKGNFPEVEVHEEVAKDTLVAQLNARVAELETAVDTMAGHVDCPEACRNIALKLLAPKRSYGALPPDPSMIGKTAGELAKKKDDE